MKVGVIIPALNEEKSVGKVIKDLPVDSFAHLVVVDNASIDNTAFVAESAGATVLKESKRGYGWACLKGLEFFKSYPVDIVVFLDADYSDSPRELNKLVSPIINESFDFVVGSRVLGHSEKGALSPHQRFGNSLATFLMRLFFGVRYTDLGPFRAIKYDSLISLEMSDKTYGWTVEMQIKAAKMNLKYKEVPVNYKRRIGVSKVSGTISGSLKAGFMILFWIFKSVLK